MFQCGASSRVGQSQHRSDDVAERHHGPDLMIGRLAQQRLMVLSGEDPVPHAAELAEDAFRAGRM
jgi:hypothetical protein